MAQSPAPLQQPIPPPSLPGGTSDEEVHKIICTQCHKRPMPDILPRTKWHHEVAKMMFLRAQRTQPQGDLRMTWRRCPPCIARWPPTWTETATSTSWRARCCREVPATDVTALPALVWLEQTTRGVFVRHTIEMGSPRHATLDVGDIDGDGDVDIVTGSFSPDRPAKSWVQVWLNQIKGGRAR